MAASNNKTTKQTKSDSPTAKQHKALKAQLKATTAKLPTFQNQNNNMSSTTPRGILKDRKI